MIAVESLSVIAGKLSPCAIGLVMEWASAHKQELLENWQLAESKSPLNWIEPVK